MLKGAFDWADEFDVYGLEMVTEEQWNWTNKLLDSLDYPFTQYFGTNQDIEFNSKEDILCDIKVIEITEDEIATFKKVFGFRGYSFGWMPDFVGPDSFYDEYGYYPETNLFK